MTRLVQPELLDLLPVTDPRALDSRRDILRLNRLMRHPKILATALEKAMASRGALRLVELGSGDGKNLLAAAQLLERRRPAQRLQATLVDQHHLIDPETIEGFHHRNWDVSAVARDIFDFLKDENSKADVIVANLVLHHFSNEQLRELLSLIARRGEVLIALEPRRSPRSLFLCRWLGLIGCNAVTRHDAAFSVEAGFEGRELSGLWPKTHRWRLTEESAGWFSHLFIAQKPV